MAASSLRRSSRLTKAVRFEEGNSYPDGPPATVVEKWIAKLDQENYLSDDYARIDDILVYSLFASKSTPNSYRALLPTRTFLQSDLPVSRDIGLEICKLYNSTARGSSDSRHVASSVTDLLMQTYPAIFCGRRDPNILRHLLQRYHIMDYRSESTIRIEKVQFHSESAAKPGKVTCGLKAKASINAYTIILATCSSMSSDLVFERPAVSIINSSPRQKGEVGPRLVLGPFRFANHDCSPNCQIIAIPNTHAFALFTLLPIATGESLTVNYASDGSYFSGVVCGCATCNPQAPPIANRRPIDHSKFLPRPNGTKTRRGGKRAKRKQRGHTMQDGGAEL